LSVNEFTTTTTASAHVTVFIGVKLQQSVCGPAPHAPTHTCRASSILMVHAALTLAVKLQLNLHISRLQSFSIKIQPKIVGLYASHS